MKQEQNQSGYRIRSKYRPLVFLIVALCVLAIVVLGENQGKSDKDIINEMGAISIDEVPEYSGEPFVIIDNNEPNFTEEYMVTESYELYSDLDKLGRCGAAQACVGLDIMPTEERGNIGSVKPTGWQTAKYDWVDGKYLYNRCHLIGYQLTGENANDRNLVTGTRYLNVDGMLPFENMIADYVKETGNHVMYRVTPIFEGDNLVCSGIHMEAKSVEDDGTGVCFNVYCYNVQPGVAIAYETGDNCADGTIGTSSNSPDAQDYVLNTGSGKFHLPTCSGASSMNQDNRSDMHCTRQELINLGYTPCGQCNP